MKTKSIFALMLGMLLVLGACNEKQEPNKDKDNQQNEGTVGGHAWVNLGLPSGTLWATCNVGANSPEEYGDYFAWGETTPKSNYSWSTYKYGTDYGELTKYCNSDYGKDGFTDNKTVLDAEDDAATANWGNGWRMPTKGEIYELDTQCSSIWTMQNSKNGRLFTGPNGNTLFLPAAGYYIDGTSLGNAGSCGYYWSSTLYDSYPVDACNLFFNSGLVNWNYYNRCYGRSVRPVVRR